MQRPYRPAHRCYVTHPSVWLVSRPSPSASRSPNKRPTRRSQMHENQPTSRLGGPIRRSPIVQRQWPPARDHLRHPTPFTAPALSIQRHLPARGAQQVLRNTRANRAPARPQSGPALFPRQRPNSRRPPVHAAATRPAFFAKPFAALRDLTRCFRACTPGPPSAGLRWRPALRAVRHRAAPSRPIQAGQPSHGAGTACTSGRPPPAIRSSQKNCTERPPSRPSIAGGCSTRLAGSPIQ